MDKLPNVCSVKHGVTHLPSRCLCFVWLSTIVPWFRDTMKSKDLRLIFLQVCCQFPMVSHCSSAFRKHKTPSPIQIQSQALLPSYPFTSFLNKTTTQPTTLNNSKSKFPQSSVYFCLIPGRSSSPPQSRQSSIARREKSGPSVQMGSRQDALRNESWGAAWSGPPYWVCALSRTQQKLLPSMSSFQHKNQSFICSTVLMSVPDLESWHKCAWRWGKNEMRRKRRFAFSWVLRSQKETFVMEIIGGGSKNLTRQKKKRPFFVILYFKDIYWKGFNQCFSCLLN